MTALRACVYLNSLDETDDVFFVLARQFELSFTDETNIPCPSNDKKRRDACLIHSIVWLAFSKTAFKDSADS